MKGTLPIAAAIVVVGTSLFLPTVSAQAPRPNAIPDLTGVWNGGGGARPVNGENVLGIEPLRAAVDKAREKGSAVLQVERDSVLRYIAVPVD